MAPLALVCVRRAGHRRLGERDAYLQTYIELVAHLEWIVSVNSTLFYQQSDKNSSHFCPRVHQLLGGLTKTD